jgi:hypothetical protein
MADAAHLDARAIAFQRFLQPPFDLCIVPLIFHVDEVDDDQPGKIAQSELPCDLIRRFHVGLECGFLDVALSCRGLS